MNNLIKALTVFKISNFFSQLENYPEEKPTIFVKSDSYFKSFNEELTEKITNASTKEKFTLSELCKLCNEFIQESNPEVVKIEKGKSKTWKPKNNKKKKVEQDPKENVVEKKVKLRSAEDVIKRILWDDVPIENCYVGYIDRFVGLVEKNFSSFSWEDIASVDYYTLAIPKHRIVYFKYKQLIVWDKRKRLDYVFGSTGSNVTFHDVLNNYEELNQKENGDNNENNDVDIDFGNYDDEFNSSSSEENDVNDEDADDNHMKFKNKEEYFGGKIKPNYFLCLRITEKEIIEKMKKLREELLVINPLYEDCILSPERLHITLCCLGLDSDEDVQKCVQSLKIINSGISKMNPADIKIQLKGTSHFFNTVLYAEVEENESFLDLCTYLRTQVKKSGINIRDMFDLHPHMTIMKISRQMSHKIGNKYLEARVHDLAKDQEFGTQNVNNIHLCLMGQQRQEDGFYICPYKMEF